MRGSNGVAYDLLAATRDVEAYTNLGDWVLNYIEASIDPRLAKAQGIVNRLRTRKLYDQVNVRDEGAKQCQYRGEGFMLVPVYISMM